MITLKQRVFFYNSPQPAYNSPQPAYNSPQPAYTNPGLDLNKQMGCTKISWYRIIIVASLD